METLKFNTHYHKAFPKTYQPTGGESLVETAGYRTAEQQIGALIAAGENLVAYNRKMYDFAIGQPDDDNYQVPVRDPNFDLADAHAIATESTARLEEQEQLFEQNKKAKRKIAKEKEEARAKRLEELEQKEKDRSKQTDPIDT